MNQSNAKYDNNDEAKASRIMIRNQIEKYKKLNPKIGYSQLAFENSMNYKPKSRGKPK